MTSQRKLYLVGICSTVKSEQKGTGNSIVETTFGLVQLNGYYQRPKATDACRVRHLKSKTEISVSALLALHVVFFDQLSGAACTWKLVDIFFVFAVSSLLVDFRTFSVNFHLKTLKNVFKKLKKLFLDFSRKISVKRWKWIKKVENYPKKCFDQFSGARSTQKLVEIHNTSNHGW